jgi:hypothetical protein
MTSTDKSRKEGEEGLWLKSHWDAMGKQLCQFGQKALGLASSNNGQSPLQDGGPMYQGGVGMWAIRGQR